MLVIGVTLASASVAWGSTLSRTVLSPEAKSRCRLLGCDTLNLGTTVCQRPLLTNGDCY
jgi:hypothetical protein